MTRAVLKALSLSDRRRWLAVAAIFALCVGPTFISYQTYKFRWDDADYLQRSIAVSRAFWSRNVHGMGEAMISIRPPVMTLLGLPWGPVTSWEAAGKCFLSLSAVISLLVALSLYLLMRMGTEPFLLVMASICVFASMGPWPAKASAHVIATGFMADSLFAWTTLAAILLIPYEARVHGPSIRSAVMRGLLWGSILSLGAMTKLSFLYFIGLIVPTVFLIRLCCEGVRSALVAFGAFACCSAPSALYLLRWGRAAFADAQASSFGGLANFYYLPLVQFARGTIRESPGLLLSLVLMAMGLTYVVIKRSAALWSPTFLAFLITVGFAAVVLAASNRQIRYAFPAIVALPFLIGTLMSAKRDSVSVRFAAIVAGLVFGGLVATSVPMRHRPDYQSINRANAVLTHADRCGARDVLLATDSPTLNMDLIDLATKFWTRGDPEIGTLAYQVMSGAPIQEDLRRIDGADEIVFQDQDELSPPFTNQRVSDYEQHVRLRGYGPTRIGEDLTVYSLHCRPGEAQYFPLGPYLDTQRAPIR
jgi:hypothetical protein